MDLSHILKYESSNDGSKIYLFHDGESPLWNAFGISAYSIEKLLKGESIRRQVKFAKDLYLPSLSVSGNVFDLLEKHGVKILKHDCNFAKCRKSPATDMEEYFQWVGEFKHLKLENIEVETPVSKFVPKGEFVKARGSFFSRSLKRALDFILSLIALIICSPILLICYIAIKMEDGGPAIFRQERMGLHGKPFHIYKFRSMRMDAEKDGPQLSHGGGYEDPRLTKVGRFLRKHHLDEFPQLYNVFIGDMAFIGHRPERKFFIDQIMDHDQRYMFLYQIRPGVTSYATLYNGYTDTMEKMLRRLDYDLYYLGHRSWWFDFKVLFNTFCSVFFGKVF